MFKALISHFDVQLCLFLKKYFICYKKSLKISIPSYIANQTHYYTLLNIHLDLTANQSPLSYQRVTCLIQVSRKWLFFQIKQTSNSSTSRCSEISGNLNKYNKGKKLKYFSELSKKFYKNNSYYFDKISSYGLNKHLRSKMDLRLSVLISFDLEVSLGARISLWLRLTSSLRFAHLS